MSHGTFRIVRASIALLAGIGAYAVAYAHEDEAAAAPTPSAPATTAEQPTLATVAGIWQAIDQQTADLAKVIQSGNLADVHHHAFAIRDLTAKLPAQSTTLPADALTKVKSHVKFVATLAERLDATGDAKDIAGTQANFEKLKKVLEGLRDIYSAH